MIPHEVKPTAQPKRRHLPKQPARSRVPGEHRMTYQRQAYDGAAPDTGEESTPGGPRHTSITRGS